MNASHAVNSKKMLHKAIPENLGLQIDVPVSIALQVCLYNILHGRRCVIITLNGVLLTVNSDSKCLENAQEGG